MRSDTPSHTARLVARSLLLASKDERLARLLAPQAAELLGVIPAVSGGWFGALLKRPWARRVMAQLERLALPGAIPHYLVRKMAIEAEVRDALAAGAERVVVLGAGFDTLASRLHGEFPAVQWIEVDHPATQALKIRSVAAGPNLRFFGHDLASPQPLSRLLEGPGSGAARTVVVLEGVTMYFSARQVADLLREVARLAGARGRVILTFMEMDRDGSIDFRGQNRAAGWWLRLCSEPFRWGISRRDLPAFLQSCGLGRERVSDHSDFRNAILRPRGLQDLPLADGECLCVCSTLPLPISRRDNGLGAKGGIQSEAGATSRGRLVKSESVERRWTQGVAALAAKEPRHEAREERHLHRDGTYGGRCRASADKSAAPCVCRRSAVFGLFSLHP